MKRVDLKKKLLEKREKKIIAAKYAHMWIDLVVKGIKDNHQLNIEKISIPVIIHFFI